MLPRRTRVTAPRSNGIAERVGEHDGARARAERRLELGRRRRCRSARSTSTNDRDQPVLEDRIDGGREAGGDGDHLVARLRAGAPPSIGDVSALTASRLADEPELTSSAWRTPKSRAKRRSNSSAKRPVVSQKSSAASTRLLHLLRVEHSARHRNRRLAGHERPSGEGARRWYSATRSRICRRGARRRRTQALRRNSRYHSTVRVSPSSRLRLGAQPSRRRALVALRYWCWISCSTSFADHRLEARVHDGEEPAGRCRGR